MTKFIVVNVHEAKTILIDQKKFKRALLEKGFRNVADRLSIDPLALMIPTSTTKSRIPLIDEIRPLIASLTRLDKRFSLVLIGSRALKKHKKYSDWDLGILRVLDGIRKEKQAA